MGTAVLGGTGLRNKHSIKFVTFNLKMLDDILLILQVAIQSECSLEILGLMENLFVLRVGLPFFIG